MRRIDQRMEMLTQLVLTGVVLLAMSALAWWLKTQRPGGVARGSGTLEARARLQLTPQHGLHLITCGGREFLVATFPTGCSVLGAAQELGSAQGLGPALADRGKA
jgi:hypothetical protein